VSSFFGRARGTWLALLATLLVSLLLAPLAIALLGDVDGDGQVTSTDARFVLEAVVGARTLTSQQSADADVDGNGRVEAVAARSRRACRTAAARSRSDATGRSSAWSIPTATR
jgi:hypothetical protein